MKVKSLLSSLLILGLTFSVQAQYTETINTNRPGVSQGAFSVGRDVLQLEAGAYTGKDKHKLTEMETKTYGAEYEIRYGLFWENLELNLRGDFMHAQQEFPVGGQLQERTFSHVRYNTIGAKFLVYDPYRRHYFDKPNLYSWKANQGIKWWQLIPAVSLYAGYNFSFGDVPQGYPLFGEKVEQNSPQVALITQHNWGGTALIMNFIADRLTDDHKRYSAIFTLTQSIGQRTTLFGEFQTIKDDFYSDELLRLGAAYLFTPDFQIDLSGMLNFKDTPERWQAGIGVSYRFDFHSQDVELIDPDELLK